MHGCTKLVTSYNHHCTKCNKHTIRYSILKTTMSCLLNTPLWCRILLANRGTPGISNQSSKAHRYTQRLDLIDLPELSLTTMAYLLFVKFIFCQWGCSGLLVLYSRVTKQFKSLIWSFFSDGTQQLCDSRLGIDHVEPAEGQLGPDVDQIEGARWRNRRLGNEGLGHRKLSRTGPGLFRETRLL